MKSHFLTKFIVLISSVIFLLLVVANLSASEYKFSSIIEGIDSSNVPAIIFIIGLMGIIFGVRFVLGKDQE